MHWKHTQNTVTVPQLKRSPSHPGASSRYSSTSSSSHSQSSLGLVRYSSSLSTGWLVAIPVDLPDDCVGRIKLLPKEYVPSNTAYLLDYYETMLLLKWSSTHLVFLTISKHLLGGILCSRSSKPITHLISFRKVKTKGQYRICFALDLLMHQSNQLQSP